MSESSSPNAELMHSLRRLVRGLSALFWGLPITLLVCVPGGGSEGLRSLGFLPPVLSTGLLLYGIQEMTYFRRTERPWRDAMEVTRLFALVNVGLSPFVFLSSKLPHEPFFNQAWVMLALSCVLFLATLNRSLQRLSAMLPDENLREETRMFSSLNLWLMVSVLFLVMLYKIMFQLAGTPNAEPPKIILILLNILSETRSFLLLFLVLLPLSITMTMVWKIKEVVLAGVFSKND